MYPNGLCLIFACIILLNVGLGPKLENGDVSAPWLGSHVCEGWPWGEDTDAKFPYKWEQKLCYQMKATVSL